MVYRDKTEQRIKLLSLSDVDHFIAYEMISSTPAISVLSIMVRFVCSACIAKTGMQFTIQFKRVTESDRTFVELVTELSSDADATVLADARYKQQVLYTTQHNTEYIHSLNTHVAITGPFGCAARSVVGQEVVSQGRGVLCACARFCILSVCMSVMPSGLSEFVLIVG